MNRFRRTHDLLGEAILPAERDAIARGQIPRPTMHASSVSSGDSFERDRTLIRRVATRDREAFEELYRAYYPRLMRYLLSHLGDRELAEEILNDVMMVVWEKASTFRGRSRTSTWVLGIAHYKVLQALRARGRRPRAVALDLADDPSATQREANGRAVDQRMLLAKALRSLSPAQRAVVELTYYYGYSYKEIAKITDCPVNTVKTRMFHARKRLGAAMSRMGLASPEEDEDA